MGVIRNLSVRVPWHDRAWDGHVCDNPLGTVRALRLNLLPKRDVTISKRLSQARPSNHWRATGRRRACVQASAFLARTPTRMTA